MAWNCAELGQAQVLMRLAEGWWRGTSPQHAATRRRYYRVVTRAELRCEIYHDLVSRRWFLERVLD